MYFGHWVLGFVWNLDIMVKKYLSRQAFLKRIKDTIDQYSMLREGDKVLVAVSGGADSVCLLISMLALAKKLGIRIAAANIDHCLRGKESEKDSAFVRELCGRLGVEFHSAKVNVRSGGKKGASVEEKARQARYDFLRKAALKAGCSAIATGHTLDDQAETVLLKIIHGGSMAGLSGIPPVRAEGKILVIRPLIRAERKDILAYLRNEGVGHVEDSTNSDVRFLRNRVRLEVIPYLERLNPKIKRSMANLADGLREDMELVESLKRRAAPEAGRVMKISGMLAQPVSARKQAFKTLFERAGGNVKKLTYRHWMDFDLFIRRAGKGRSLDLPGGVSAVRRENEIVFESKSSMN